MADERVPRAADSAASSDDAAALVEAAWVAEVGLRLAERSAALDAAECAVERSSREPSGVQSPDNNGVDRHQDGVEQLSSHEPAGTERPECGPSGTGTATPGHSATYQPGPRPPDGRDPASELRAERALDAARLREVEVALRFADQVLGDESSSEIARARACEAKARALAFSGSDASVRRAERALREAIDRYDALTASPWGAVAHEWHGYALFGLAYVVHGLSGRLAEARALMDEALDRLDATSPRRPTVLAFYADALIAQRAGDARSTRQPASYMPAILRRV